MVSQRLAKPSYFLDSLSSSLSAGATYTPGVTVALRSPKPQVKVRILGGMPYISAGIP